MDAFLVFQDLWTAHRGRPILPCELKPGAPEIVQTIADGDEIARALAIEAMNAIDAGTLLWALSLYWRNFGSPDIPRTGKGGRAQLLAIVRRAYKGGSLYVRGVSERDNLEDAYAYLQMEIWRLGVCSLNQVTYRLDSLFLYCGLDTRTQASTEIRAWIVDLLSL